MSQRNWRLLLGETFGLCVVLALAGCGEKAGAGGDASSMDGAAVDSPHTDAESDAGPDGSRDAARDASGDSGPDASPDASGPGWRSEPALPVALQEITAITREGHIWVIGGFEGFTDVATVRIYDPASRVWSEGPALPAARHHTHVAEVAGDLFVLGGMETISFSLVDTAWVLRAGASTWAPIRRLPEVRGAGVAGVVDGRIYLGGGVGRGGGLADAVLSYDPATDSWATGAPIPTPREHLAAFVHGGELWAVGGRRLSLSSNTDIVEIYDPSADAWRPGPALGLPRGGFAIALAGDVAYAVGGEQSDRALHEAEALALPAGAWAPIAPVPTPRHGHAMAAAGGRIYVIGGADVPTFGAVATVESFAP